jgi:hypothetical protein
MLRTKKKRKRRRRNGSPRDDTTTKLSPQHLRRMRIALHEGDENEPSWDNP